MTSGNKRKASYDEDADNPIASSSRKQPRRTKMPKQTATDAVVLAHPSTTTSKSQASGRKSKHKSDTFGDNNEHEHESGEKSDDADDYELPKISIEKMSDEMRIQTLATIPGVLTKFDKIQKAFANLSHADLVYFFASDPDCTQRTEAKSGKAKLDVLERKARGSVEETEDVQNYISGMMNQVMFSSGFVRAILHPKHIQTLSEWANWLTLSHEQRAKQGIGSQKNNLKTVALDLRAWFRFTDEELSVSDIADYAQLHLYGVEIDDDRQSAYTMRCQKWQTITASKILRAMELGEPVPDGAETSFAPHTALELVGDITEEEKQAIHAAAARYDEKAEDDALDAPQLFFHSDQFGSRALEKGKREHSEAFANSSYTHINAFDLERMLEKIYQRFSNVKNEPMVARLLQAGKKRRLDQLAKESAPNRKKRVTREKARYEKRRASKKEVGNLRGKEQAAAKKRWASHIDTELSLEQSLFKAIKMENEGTEPESDPDLEAEASVSDDQGEVLQEGDDFAGEGSSRPRQRENLITRSEGPNVQSTYDGGEATHGHGGILHHHENDASRVEDGPLVPKISYKDYLPAESGESSEES